MVAGLGSAHAADLPARVAPAPYVAPLPVFTWTGAYFGINAGADFDNQTRFALSPATASDNGIGGNRPAAFKNSDSGFTAGGQIGYNYEFGGVNASDPAPASWSASRRMPPTSTLSQSSTPTMAAASRRCRPDQCRSAQRARLPRHRARPASAYAFNQFLIYGTGGFAYGDVFENGELLRPTGQRRHLHAARESGFQTGYAYGGGVEYALPNGLVPEFLPLERRDAEGRILALRSRRSNFSVLTNVCANAANGSASPCSLPKRAAISPASA